MLGVIPPAPVGVRGMLGVIHPVPMVGMYTLVYAGYPPPGIHRSPRYTSHTQ